jgi:hypothetical protein
LTKKGKAGSKQDGLSRADKLRIGRRGEEYIFLFLKEKYKSKYKNIKISKDEKDRFIMSGKDKKGDSIEINLFWTARKDKYSAYDKEIIKYKNGKQYHRTKVEVKATLEKEEAPARFSVRECQELFSILAANKNKKPDEPKRDYCIYRLYKAGDKDAWPRKIKNILDKVKEGEEKLHKWELKI